MSVICNIPWCEKKQIRLSESSVSKKLSVLVAIFFCYKLEVFRSIIPKGLVAVIVRLRETNFAIVNILHWIFELKLVVLLSNFAVLHCIYHDLRYLRVVCSDNIFDFVFVSYLNKIFITFFQFPSRHLEITLQNIWNWFIIIIIFTGKMIFYREKWNSLRS